MGRHRVWKCLVGVGLLLVSLAAPGCGSGTGQGLELTIVSGVWSGWDPDHTPTLETVKVPAVVGSEAEIMGMGSSDKVTLKVVAAGPDSVEIQLSQLMAPGRDAADIMNPRDRFTVKLGESTIFSTPSDDAGVNHEVTLSAKG